MFFWTYWKAIFTDIGKVPKEVMMVYIHVVYMSYMCVIYLLFHVTSKQYIQFTEVQIIENYIRTLTLAIHVVND